MPTHQRQIIDSCRPCRLKLDVNTEATEDCLMKHWLYWQYVMHISWWFWVRIGTQDACTLLAYLANAKVLDMLHLYASLYQLGSWLNNLTTLTLLPQWLGVYAASTHVQLSCLSISMSSWCMHRAYLIDGWSNLPSLSYERLNSLST